MNRFFICFIFVCFLLPVFGQDKTQIIQQRIEFISEQLQSEEIDLTNITIQLNYYFEHPLNLNSATLEELEAFAMKEGNEPVKKSAKQEYFEMVLNQYM